MFSLRARLIGIGIVAMLLAVLVQLRTDAALNSGPGPVVSLRATLFPNELPTITPPVRVPQLFFVRPQGIKGEIIAYDMATARAGFKLPRGLPSADWNHYFSASAEPDDTIVEDYALANEDLDRSFTLGGKWSLESVSATGRWLALSRILSDREMIDLRKEKKWITNFEIVDTADGSVAHSFVLDGDYQADALSDETLFLTEHPPAADPDPHAMRFCIFDRGGPPAEPAQVNCKPDVIAEDILERVATPDGRFLLTLYLDARLGVASIQITNLINKYPVIIYLPGMDRDQSQLKKYSLALSPDGQEVYAVNAALGVIDEVSLNTGDLPRASRFAPQANPVAGASTSAEPRPASTVSKNGQELFYTDGSEIWAFDTGTLKETDSYELVPEVYGLGVNDAGDRLYAATPSDSARVFIVPKNVTLVPLK